MIVVPFQYFVLTVSGQNFSQFAQMGLQCASGALLGRKMRCTSTVLLQRQHAEKVRQLEQHMKEAVNEKQAQLDEARKAAKALEQKLQQAPRAELLQEVQHQLQAAQQEAAGYKQQLDALEADAAQRKQQALVRPTTACRYSWDHSGDRGGHAKSSRVLVMASNRRLEQPCVACAATCVSLTLVAVAVLGFSLVMFS
jgi:exonuclease VII large subunit